MDVKYRYGKGTPVLFAGPPGTGKTMAAHVLSNMLNIPLYKVDLSQVADKYIGETEKHLSKIFDYADENETLLFFDEADSLFGKRSEVKDSKDRYANMEISYILQRIEQFDGIAILATNLRENMDSAFIRRMKYIVDFIMPNKEMRYQIWKNAFSNQVPTKDVDFEYLAEQFELSGGNIKNIVLTATFMAAGKNTPVNMGCLLEAVENEYSKYNKKMTIKDYGKYGYLAI
jgi:SpoVK/Ycf46/Vps4 family AAA+-type ATPase